VLLFSGPKYAGFLHAFGYEHDWAITAQRTWQRVAGALAIKPFFPILQQAPILGSRINQHSQQLLREAN
jgi:hypothetical protein